MCLTISGGLLPRPSHRVPDFWRASSAPESGPNSLAKTLPLRPDRPLSRTRLVRMPVPLEVIRLVLREKLPRWFRQFLAPIVTPLFRYRLARRFGRPRPATPGDSALTPTQLRFLDLYTQLARPDEETYP
jgi:hypothetical protein